MNSSRRPAFAASALALLAAAAAAQTPQPSVTLTNGAKIYGQLEQRDGYSANEYLGIRYATAQRFANPTPFMPTGTVQATQPGAICPQYSSNGVIGAEDCFFLNVWTPTSATATSKLPVLVYIHGGAFIAGSSTGGADGILFDGTELSNLGGNGVTPQQNLGLVVVTFNYRLGPLGFMTYNDGTVPPIIGNYGFWDQIAALDWVQKNIAAFGGNPGNVTIAGQSAGAISVGYHAFSSNFSGGLFQQIVMESNPLGLQMPPAAASGITPISQDTATRAGCTGRSVNACLRSVDFKTLTEQGFNAYANLVTSFNSGSGAATNLLPWGPILDQETLVRQPLAGARSRAFPGPVLIGTNSGEGGFFQYSVEELLFAKTFSGTISQTFFNNFAASLFPNNPLLPGPYQCSASNCGAQFARLITDYVFTCGTHALLETTPSGAPVFAYQFQHIPSWGYPACSTILPISCVCGTESCHSAELPFVWDGAQAVGGSFTSQESQLSDQMARLWASLVANGNPNKPNGLWNTIWPYYGEGTYLVLDVGNLVPSTAVASAANCVNDWDPLGYEGLPGTGH